MVVTQYCTRRNIKTNHPFLKEIKKFDWEKDFLSYDNIVEFLNKKLDMSVLTQEFAYVIAFNYHNIPVGLYELSHGMQIDLLLLIIIQMELQNLVLLMLPLQGIYTN